MSRNDNGTHGRTRIWRFRHVVHRYINPITRPVAKKLPTFAILTHRGRKTGRTYRTPINVFRQGNDYFFLLTYGSDVQWMKNILATLRLPRRSAASQLRHERWDLCPSGRRARRDAPAAL